MSFLFGAAHMLPEPLAKAVATPQKAQFICGVNVAIVLEKKPCADLPAAWLPQGLRLLKSKPKGRGTKTW